VIQTKLITIDQVSTIFFFTLAVNVTIDTEGLIDAVGRGWKPGYGSAPGIVSTSGGSGASHGGLGGRGNGNTISSPSYSNVQQPTKYGSGGSVGTGTSDGGEGGGILYLKASHNMEIDGDIKVDGKTAETITSGGGSGGSVLLEAPHFTGKRFMVYGVQCHFQQYFSYIVAVRFIGGENQSVRENHRPVASH